MPTPTASTCPTWCDPRSHAGDAAHATTPVVHAALVDDVEVETGVRLDGTTATVSLGIRNLASVWPGGSPVEADAGLLPCEAEVLGHRLIALAATARAASPGLNVPRQQGGQ